MATEEFTFPIADLAQSPIDSPPLWCLSPTASPQKRGYNSDDHLQLPENHRSLKKATHLDMINPRRSCSFIEASLLKRLKMIKGDDNYHNYDPEDEEEHDEDDQREKMDLLWEDLNDDLSKVNEHSRKGSTFNGRELVGFVPASFNKLAKGNVINGSANIVSNSKNNKVVKSKRSTKKPSMIVLMKVFKKLFLLHHSQQSAKNQSC